MLASAGLETLFITYLAALGLSVGSFLNVVIARVPEGLSIVRPRSRCPKCGHQLPWYENIPVFSWVMLRGKCSGCKTPISPRYVFVELLTGALFVLSVGRFGWTWQLVGALTFIMLLVPLVFIDAEHWVLPYELTLPGFAVGVLLRAPLGLSAVLDGLIGAVAGFLFFRMLEYVGWLFSGEEAMGGGDKFLMAMVGATLGWRPLLGVVFLSSLQGAVYGVTRKALTGRAGPSVEPAPVEPAAPFDSAQGERDVAVNPTPAHPEPVEGPASAPGAPFDSAQGERDVAVSPTPVPPEALAAPFDSAQGERDVAVSPTPVLPEAPAAPFDSAQGERDVAGPGPVPEPAGEAAPDDGRLPFTPAFLEPGLKWWKRLQLLPYTLLWQDIPDSPPPDEETGEEPEWVPGASNLPFGPWIGLAALEVLLWAPWLARALGPTRFGLAAELMFGKF